MAFTAILTTVGLARLATAQATSTPLVFTHLAVGDGNGAPIAPGQSMTALVHEVARVPINAVDLDPDDVDIVRVEGLIPDDVGGFIIREAGLFNGAGELIAIASYPPIFKPTFVTDGVSVQEYIRILIGYMNVTDAIALTVDTSVIIATRIYVDQDIAKAFKSLIVRDHFSGTQVDLGKWLINAGDASVIDDSANGGSGSLKLEADVGNPVQNLTTQNLVIGTDDFRYECRVRRSVNNTSGSFGVGVGFAGGVIGFVGGGTAPALLVSANAANWHLITGADGGTDVDLGVAPSATYQTIVIKRVGGILTVVVDGVQKYSAAMATTVLGSIGAGAERDGASCTLLADSISFSCGLLAGGA